MTYSEPMISDIKGTADAVKFPLLFEDIENNDMTISRLTSAAERGRVHHAYIFEGPSNADKTGFAMAFAKALMCTENRGRGCGRCRSCRRIENGNYIDLMYIAGEASKDSSVRSVKDDDIDKLITRLYSKPFDGSRNIAIVADADSMSAKAMNHLLKTFEEPPAGTVIMLLSENINRLPVTLRSRAVHCLVEPFGGGARQAGAKRAEKIVHGLLAKEPYYRIKKYLSDIGKDRDEAYEVLDAMETVFRNILTDGSIKTDREVVYAAVAALEEARSSIRRSVSVQYAMKTMALKIGGHI